MRTSTLLKYAAPVPRYTSYPTAPNFSPAVDAIEHRNWLGELRDTDSLSLYFHVPFCRALCWFCGCHTSVARDPHIKEAYADLLRRELALVASAIPSPAPIRHIHWGGGTPTEIGEDMLRRIMMDVADNFAISEDAEIAVEVDPRTFVSPFADSLATLGFNRVSIGVQDIDPAVQAAVNRIQPLGLNRAVVDTLRAAGIEHLNIDLMVGLPGQTDASVARSVSAAIEALHPNRVSVFAYAHVPWMKRHQRLIDESKLPDPRARLAQAETASRVLVDNHYVPVGLDHFARPDDAMALAARRGTLRRNFQGYVTDGADALIGIGASAISSLPQGYSQNEPRVPEYRRAIERDDFATARGIELSRDDRARRDIIERLMCDLAVDLDAVADRWRMSAGDFDAAIEALEPLVADGLVDISKARVEVRDEARPIIRSVCSAFDTYLDKGAARHAAGI